MLLEEKKENLIEANLISVVSNQATVFNIHYMHAENKQNYFSWKVCRGLAEPVALNKYSN